MKKRIPLFPVIVLITCIIAVTMVINRRLDSSIVELRSLAADTRLEQIDLESEKSGLEQEINRKDQDSYIIQIARREYGYMLPGEIRFEVTNIDDLYAVHEVIVSEEEP